MIINAGLKEVIYNLAYPMGDTPMNLLGEAGIELKELQL